jgi:hypothetical protein
MENVLPFVPRARSRIRIGTRQVGPLLRLPIFLGPQELSSHLHVMGVTGQGKSKFLAHLASELILSGQACSVIDPHSDLAHDILRILWDRGYFRRANAMEKVRYINFADRERHIAFNVLSQPYPTDEIARNLVEACMRAWPALDEGAAPQFENVLLASATVLIENHLPLTHLTRLLTDRDFREQLLTHVTDPDVVTFFHDRFDAWGRDTPQLIESTLRRVFLIGFSPALRYSLGQTHNSLNLREAMDHQTSLIFNLGGLDEQTQRLIGCFLNVGFEVAALSRADLPESKRQAYHLLVDEFSQFSATSEEALSRVLSLCRKYGLFCCLAHQTWNQLSSRLQGALANSLPLYFRLGYDDAVWAAPRLGQANPYHVKHEVKPLGGKELPMEHHPLFFQLQEEYEAWTRRIENLWPRQAYIKITRHVPRQLQFLFKRTRTIRIRTADVKPGRCTPSQLEALIERYAKLYLTPRVKEEQAEESLGENGPPETRRLVDATPTSRAVPRKGALQAVAQIGARISGVSANRDNGSRRRAVLPLDKQPIIVIS